MAFTHSVRALFLAPALMVAVAPEVRAQHTTPPPVVVAPDRSGIGEAPADGDEASARLARDMAKKANSERQTALKNDAEKLLKLAVELKASVDKSNEHLLSMEVVKKAEEIEKLAHSVKDKMKGPN